MAPEIWLYDIETSPNLSFHWGLWDQNIGLNQIVETQDILCFAATKIGSGKIESHTAWDDYDAMLARLHEIMDRADYVAGYNHISYDNKHVQAAFLKAGMPPPSPFRNIDLMRVVKKNFKFQSNKLAHVCQQLGLDAKGDPGGFDTWKQIMIGEGAAQEAARKRMVRYCRLDCKITAQLYQRLTPYLEGLNIPLVTGEDEACEACTRCGSHDVQSRGWAYTTTMRYKRFRCMACGGWLRSRRSEPTPTLLASL